MKYAILFCALILGSTASAIEMVPTESQWTYKSMIIDALYAQAQSFKCKTHNPEFLLELTRTYISSPDSKVWTKESGQQPALQVFYMEEAWGEKSSFSLYITTTEDDKAIESIRFFHQTSEDEEVNLGSLRNPKFGTKKTIKETIQDNCVVK